MTPEEFLDAYHSQTPLAFAATVSQLSEAQRRGLSKTAQQIVREAREQERDLRRPEVLQTLMTNGSFNRNVFDERRMNVLRATLTILAVGPKSSAVKPTNWSDETARAAIRIVRDRRPDWADAWLEAQLTVRWGLLRYENARELIDAGVCQRPKSLGYARMYGAAAVKLDHAAQPDLFEDLWLLFQHDVGTWSGIAPLKKINLEQWQAHARPQSGEGYWGSYARLVYHHQHHGHIDRSRVIDEILAALWRDFGSSSRSGLITLHELINPSAEERSQRQSAYRELLQHSAPAIVGFGLRVLKQLQKEGKLDVEPLLSLLPQVMSLKPKVQPTAALSLLKSLIKDRADLISSGIDVAAAALIHESLDVQECAIELLESWSGQADGAWSQTLSSYQDVIAAKFRERLHALLSKIDPNEVREVDPLAKATPIETVDRAGLRQRLAAIPEDLQQEYGLPEALDAVQSQQLPSPLDIDRLSDVLCDLQPVVPIRDLDELIDTVSRVVESYGTPMDYERILDAICRMREDYPPDFSARTQSLLNRIQIWFFTVPAFKLLILEWLTRSHDLVLHQGFGMGLFPQANSEPSHYAHLLSSRIHVIRSRLKTHEFGPLLSLPTHDQGWIDPRVLVQRIRQSLERGILPNRNDLSFALLRLAPDFRNDAIEQSRSLPEPYHSLIAYALGFEISPAIDDPQWAGPWLSAGRTRSPRGRLPELSAFAYPSQTNSIEPAEFTWHLSVFEDIQGKQWHLHQRVEVISVTPEIPSDAEVDQFPTMSLARSVPNYRGSFFNDRHDEWMSTLWPANSDCTIAAGMRLLIEQLYYNSSVGQLDGTLSSLLRTDRSWSPVAVTALWLGLISHDASISGLARDALASGIMDGRAHPKSLIPGLHSIVPRKWFKWNRLVTALRDVSRISRWAALVTVHILDSLISSWKTPPRDAYLLLELHSSLLSDLQLPLTTSAAEILSPWTGTGKAAKLARVLCQMRFDQSPGREAALWEGLEIRTARAERVASKRRSAALN